MAVATGKQYGQSDTFWRIHHVSCLEILDDVDPEYSDVQNEQSFSGSLDRSNSRCQLAWESLNLERKVAVEFCELGLSSSKDIIEKLYELTPQATIKMIVALTRLQLETLCVDLLTMFRTKLDMMVVSDVIKEHIIPLPV